MIMPAAKTVAAKTMLPLIEWFRVALQKLILEQALLSVVVQKLLRTENSEDAEISYAANPNILAVNLTQPQSKASAVTNVCEFE